MSSQLDELSRQLSALRETLPDSPVTDLVRQAIAEFSLTVEELRVAEEEIRQQADELATSHDLLDTQRRRYQDLFDFAPDGYLVTDGDGTIREANRAAGVLFDRAPANLPGKPMMLYVMPEALREFRQHVTQAALAETAQVWDTRLKTPDLAGRDVECTVAPIRAAETKRLLELRWRLHDIGDRKRSETELQGSRESLREVAGRMEAVREEERARVARAVHDEIGAALTAIKMDLAQVRHNLAHAGQAEGALRAAEDRTQAASRMVDETMQTVRRIAMELRPAVLDDFGLVAALDWQLTEFQKRTGLEVGLSVAPGKDELDPASATAVFRVFQEILTNVMRHAAATRVEVRLFQEDQALVLDVRDNGRGIRAEEAVGQGSMGLLGMRERVRLRGGQVEVSGAPGEGTQVRVTVPLGAKNAPPDGPAA